MLCIPPVLVDDETLTLLEDSAVPDNGCLPMVTSRTTPHELLDMFGNGTIYIAPNLKVNELLSEDKEDELIKLIEEEKYIDPTIEVCTPDDFEAGFEEGIKADNAILRNWFLCGML